MDDKNRLKEINNHIQKDAFANYLGAKVKIIKPGQSRVSLIVKDHMTNFHGTAHGGIIFAISDMAFAAACNSHGKVAVALNVSICFLRPAYPGDHLVAEAKEEHNSRRTALYPTFRTLKLHLFLFYLPKIFNQAGLNCHQLSLRLL